MEDGEASVQVLRPHPGFAQHLLGDGDAIVAEALVVLTDLWWLFVLFAFARWLAPKPIARAIAAALVAYAVSAAIWWWVPAMPVLTSALMAPTARRGEPILKLRLWRG